MPFPDLRFSTGFSREMHFFEKSLTSGDLVEFRKMLVHEFIDRCEGMLVGISIFQYDHHEYFIGAQRKLAMVDRILSRFERMYEEGAWDCNNPWKDILFYANRDELIRRQIEQYGGDERRGPSKDARNACYYVRKVREQFEEATRLIFVRNEKWLAWTRAADDPDAYLQEAIASGAVRVCDRDDPSLVLVDRYGPREGMTYDVSGWGAFKSLFRYGEDICDREDSFYWLMRLTDVHPQVADLLLAAETKNQDPNATERYYVRVEWVWDGLCRVGGMSVDAFRPKKRAKLARKSGLTCWI